MPISECKAEAKKRLRTRKLRTFRITLCIAALSVLSGFASFFLPQMITSGKNTALLLLVIQIALIILTVGLLGTLRQGRTAWLYCNACGKEPSGVQFRFWLRKGRGLRAAMLHLSVGIRKACYTLLLCAPGCAIIVGSTVLSETQSAMIRYISGIGGAICAGIGLFFSALICQKYALAQILYARSPQKGIRSAVRGSCFLMDGSCMQLLRLKLSFLPWAIPCLAVLPMIYVMPYYQQTTTCMLRKILRAHTI